MKRRTPVRLAAAQEVRQRRRPIGERVVQLIPTIIHPLRDSELASPITDIDSAACGADDGEDLVRTNHLLQRITRDRQYAGPLSIRSCARVPVDLKETALEVDLNLPWLGWKEWLARAWDANSTVGKVRFRDPLCLAGALRRRFAHELGRQRTVYRTSCARAVMPRL
jgi:hypothetical protein